MNRRRHKIAVLVLALLALFAAPSVGAAASVREYPVPRGSHPHDVAPAVDGGVWYTAQLRGALGYLDVKTGRTQEIALGKNSAPHGVIVGPDGAPWITDGGLNAIVRVDPKTQRVDIFPLPPEKSAANLNTATFDKAGVLWFTGQSGVYGKLDPHSADTAKRLTVFDAPGGAGPYGICTAPDGSVYYASLAGSHIARIDTKTGRSEVLSPPTSGQGARRVWADSKNNIWVSEWHGAQLARYTPATKQWKEWRLPGDQPQPYAVYVDERDHVWLSDFGANAMIEFDPTTEKFTVVALPSANASVRQILGRRGEVWGAESGADKLIRITTH